MSEKYKNNSKYAFVIGILIGVIAFLFIYGINVVNPTNVEWLYHTNDLEGSIDLTQHHLGWEAYRNTAWRFPIGLTDGLYSKPVSVVYTDSIPIFAVVFKVFSSILPEHFQYMGIFGLMCYALMGGFGALITRRVSNNVFLNVISSAFFVLSPVMLNRMYLHTSLSAHFLIVAGIVLWLYRDKMRYRRYLLAEILLLAGGTMINAYFTPILLGILLCSELQNVICGEKIITALKTVIIPMLFVLFFSWIMGVFYGDTNASGSGGLDVLSFNLDGFFNPATYQTAFGHFNHDFVEVSYSRLLRGFPLMTPYQNEGFAYLGLGMIMLCVVAFVFLVVAGIRMVRVNGNKKNIGENKYYKRKRNSIIIALVVYFVVFIFLALSPHWTLGEKSILIIHYPTVVWNLLSTFRSTGRFIWPVYYMIMTLALMIPSYIYCKSDKELYSEKIFGKRRHMLLEGIVCLMLLLALVTQVVDLSFAMRDKRAAFTHVTDYSSDLKNEKWDEIANKFDTLVFYPPSQNLYWDGLTAMTFEKYVIENNLSMNNTYLSRDLTDIADEKTLKEFQEIKSGKVYPRHLYVFVGIPEEKLPNAEEYNLNYYNIDGYTVACDKSINL